MNNQIAKSHKIPWTQSLSQAAGSVLSIPNNSGLLPCAITGGSMNLSPNYPGHKSGWFKEERTYTDEYVKRYEVIEATEDVLALSCAWYRIREQRKSNKSIKEVHYNISNLLDQNLFRQVNSEDRAFATIIKEYYGQKIVVWTLKEIKLTQFRTDLSQFVHGDGKRVAESILPLVFKLPEFYVLDSAMDVMKRELSLEIPNFHEVINYADEKKTYALTPIKVFERKTKRFNRLEYWLRDILNNAYCIHLETNNPLQHIWDYLFYSGTTLSIKGHLVPTELDEFQYYRLSGWTVAE